MADHKSRFVKHVAITLGSHGNETPLYLNQKEWCDEKNRERACVECLENFAGNQHIQHDKCRKIVEKHFGFPDTKKHCAGGCGKLKCNECWNVYWVTNSKSKKVHYCNVCLNPFCVECVEHDDEFGDPICSNIICRLRSGIASEEDGALLEELADIVFRKCEGASNKKRKREHRK